MRTLLISFLLYCVASLAFAGDDGEMTAEPDDSRYPQKFSNLGDDPIFQALAALADGPLKDEVENAIAAFYGSRFDEAHTRVATVMAKHSEADIGGVLYNFLLLMDGAALGFTEHCSEAIESLNKLQNRLESDIAGGAVTDDDLAGVISLKADIYEASGEKEAALTEMDRLIDRFGNDEDSDAHWRVLATMQRKALLLDDLGRSKESERAFQAYLDARQRESEEDGGDETSDSE